MAVTIKLKNASGSDPSASDLVVGEVAIRTDNGKLFTKKDNGSVAEITGGGGIDDGDKGDITVSNSGETFTIDNGVITSAKIANGAIALTDMGASSVGTSQLVAGAVTNAKVASNAAIALSKLEVITSNRIVGNDSGNAVPKELTAAEVRSIINVEDGATADQSASEILTLLKTVDGAGSGLDADTLDGISSASFVRSDANDSITGHLTITNDSGLKVRSSTNGNGAVINFSDHAGGSYAQNGSITYKHADGAVTSTGGSSNDGWLFEGSETRTVVKVVGDIEATSNIYGAGANITALNASNISSGTISDARLPSSISSDITGNAATATKLATARTIAGVSFDGSANISLNNNAITNGAGYITATLTNEQVQDIVGGMVSGNTETGITVTYQDSDGTLDFVIGTLGTGNIANNAIDFTKIQDISAGRIIGRASGSSGGNPDQLTAAQVRTIINVEDGATADQSASEILTLLKTVDGAGSGLDADTLDGISSASFVRSDASDTLTGGTYTLNSSTAEKIILQGASNPFIRFQEGTTDKAYIQWHSDGYLQLANAEDGSRIRIKDDLRFTTDNFSSTNYKIWHAGNDGSGSGLDADLLDGLNAAESGNSARIVRTNASGYIFANFVNISPDDRSSGLTKICCETGNDGYIRHATAAGVRSFINVENGATADQSASEILTLIKTVDGAGSGLDADTLDGISSASFLRSDANDTFTAVLTLSNSGRDCFNFSANSTEDGRGIAFNGRAALTADYNDGYLRLNQYSEFGNGVYTPLVMRADGGFQVDSTTVINGSAQLIASRLTGALPAIDGSALTGISAGATGGGSDEVFYENGQTVTTNYTITNGKNAMAAGPITINSGVTVTVGSGETLTIV